MLADIEWEKSAPTTLALALTIYGDISSAYCSDQPKKVSTVMYFVVQIHSKTAACGAGECHASLVGWLVMG